MQPNRELCALMQRSYDIRSDQIFLGGNSESTLPLGKEAT